MAVLLTVSMANVMKTLKNAFVSMASLKTNKASVRLKATPIVFLYAFESEDERLDSFHHYC